MTFLLLACDSKSSWLNSFRKRYSSKTEMGAEDEAIRVDESRLPTPNLNDCLSPSNVKSEIWRKKGAVCGVYVVGAEVQKGVRRGGGLVLYRAPRLGVAVFAPAFGLGKGGRLGVEVAHLGVGHF
ncbi:hypothetical protein PIB30_099685, partial [Stylosanthes scabra]|nr:hypothetical protein [Stylosanthes scabra]